MPDNASVEGLDWRMRRLLAIEGVVGVDWGLTDAGQETLIAYLRDEEVLGRLPSMVDRVPVRAVITGEIEAYR